MTIEIIDKPIKCPECGSRAIYKYGKTYYHLQRYKCLMCDRQFVPGHERIFPGVRPECPACGSRTHVFKKKGDTYSVFRCSRYPVCRTYVRVTGDELSRQGGDTHDLLHAPSAR